MSRESHALRIAAAFSALAWAICCDSKLSSGRSDDDVESFSSAVGLDTCEESPSCCETLDDSIVTIQTTQTLAVCLTGVLKETENLHRRSPGRFLAGFNCISAALVNAGLQNDDT